MYAAYAPRLVNIASVGAWYKKRLIRLLLPFYWYLAVHYALMLLFPTLFSGLGLQKSWKFIFQSITLIGGINLNWLPLLFLQLAVLFPVLVLLQRKKNVLFWLYLCVAFFLTVFFTIWQFPYSAYRQVMWIPWSLFMVLPWYFYERERKKYSPLPYFLLSALGATCFAFLYIVWIHLGRSVTLIDNKYPPNFFYITYEMFGSFLLVGIGLWPFLKRRMLAAIIQFISKTSYALFFIHYIVLDFVLSVNKLWGNGISIWYQTLFVIFVSLAIAWILLQSQKRLHTFLQSHTHLYTFLL